MGKIILLDTNIIIYYLNDVAEASAFLEKHYGNMAISTVTVAEVLFFPYSPEALLMVETFLKENFTWFDVSREIIFQSASIRREKKMKLPDALIGATAIYHQLDLVSRNERDFNRLPIRLINPMDN